MISELIGSLVVRLIWCLNHSYKQTSLLLCVFYPPKKLLFFLKHSSRFVFNPVPHFILSFPTLCLCELLDTEAAAVKWHLSSLWNDPSAGMSACITGILSLIFSPIPQMSKCVSFTEASKTLPNFSPKCLNFPRGLRVCRASVFPFESHPTGFDGIFLYYMSQLHSTERNVNVLKWRYKLGRNSVLTLFWSSDKTQIYLLICFGN